ncbi:elongation factor P maturation arginine rhamnosyltransferase EarP [Shewanella psychropiezotolerans]|uniref:Protein-arginine rhamnosyltransferase n=1 Tax=Shewanella psychropiezotolerans TaxID=2593655 RepID=A0ABX5WY39_9GAMM|nr:MULTISPECIES: elongation factor P maturation arginine rhamnosyltransferase EarP [Shewanella]MPY23728.1 elongation factor P maturation arginine rhamnosyltransferase EarP [Shewanella sp. YLB-07]QDO84000.1 elongation factor P maturation arginine rhamnosyltransferase EarP [Shewanella psychropiezotolerans]
MIKPLSSSGHWDIFCAVIDNYGDIGVTWRLAKQLVHDFDIEVRLWVDDLKSFAHILPELDITLSRQEIMGVRIYHWRQPLPEQWQAGDVLIEAFACNLPACVLDQLASLDTPPRWLNLEYLSAEDWIDSCHGLPSLQSNGISKHFYFPGFTPSSGGLLCEHGLFEARDSWQGEPTNRAHLLKQLGIDGVNSEDTLISVFSYESSALLSLCQSWRQATKRIHALIPMGRSLNSLKGLIPDGLSLVPGDSLTLNSLTLHILPMTDQGAYDRLLWSCDFNIVRGEDSFIRAQWAAKPFIWHIYGQENDAHLDKLSAFSDRYIDSLDEDTGQAWSRLNLAFNQEDGEITVKMWKELHERRTFMDKHATKWPMLALNHADLATRLVQFVKKG